MTGFVIVVIVVSRRFPPRRSRSEAAMCTMAHTVAVDGQKDEEDSRVARSRRGCRVGLLGIGGHVLPIEPPILERTTSLGASMKPFVRTRTMSMSSKPSSARTTAVEKVM